MLREAIEATGISPDRAAMLMGVSPKIFHEWIAEQRPIPHSILSLLSTVIGFEFSAESRSKLRSRELADITPAIWYRFRGRNLIDEDREYIFLIRQLGYFINELEEITGSRAVGWKALFRDIRDTVDRQAPPRAQGREAARIFRESRGLNTGATSIGDVIRGNLRSMGLLVVETPIPKSQIEGCCFFVGPRQMERPCLFANTHHATWFRRNMVIAHEVAHAIFDTENAGATLDFRADDDGDLSEERADAFAQEVLIPHQVLQHIAQKNGVKWDCLSVEKLASMVADTQVEARTVLRAAAAVDFINDDEFKTYLKLDIGQLLPSLTEHALSAADYIKKVGDDTAQWMGKRNTTIPLQTLRLPSSYVKTVLAAFTSGQIGRGKAAEMLMIDNDTFSDRFSDLNEPFDEPLDTLATESH